jgi:hypothetical protein
MATTIDQYREAKQNYLKLRTQAKKELVARFHQLAGELLQVQRELLEDFGEKVVMPSSKGKKPLAKKAAKVLEVTEVVAGVVVGVKKDSPKVLALKKQLEVQIKKLEVAKAAGKPVKAIEDRIYEIEDDIRVAE